MNQSLTIYRASAGSGKTFRLTLKYLMTLLGVRRPDGSMRLNHRNYGSVRRNVHREILAITFTNKATEEMKTRIVEQLSALPRLANADNAARPDAMTQMLMREIPCQPHELAEAAQDALRQLLADYRNFNVSTIDAFFQQVLRNMAYELDSAGDFRVTLDNEDVVSQGIALMFDEFNDSTDPDRLRSPLAKALLRFMQARRQNGTDFNIFNRGNNLHGSIIRAISDLFDEKYQLISAEFEAWLSQPGAVEKFADSVRVEQNRISEAVKARALDIAYKAESYGYMKKGVLNATNVLRRLETALQGKTMGTDVFGKGYFGEMRNGTISVFTAKYKNMAGADEFTEDYRAFASEYASLSLRAAILDIMAAQVDNFFLMRHAAEYIRRFRNSNNLVVLAETNELLSRIMGVDNQVPFIYEKMGVRLRNFFIDEFQDTSRLQWHNLRPLVDNSIAEGGENLIIGDVKQAIYRFRNSDSTLLHKVLTQQYPFAQIQGYRPEENTNRRSAAAIVRFNNTLFARWAKLNGLDTYGDVTQSIAPEKKDLPGYVCLLPVYADDNADENDNADEKSTVADKQMLAMVGQILRQHDDGYRWRDIAVLVNKKKQGVLAVDALMKAGIPVVTEEALLLVNSSVVNTIISTLKLMTGGVTRRKQNEKGNTAAAVQSMIATFDVLVNKHIAAGCDAERAYRLALDEAFRPEGPVETGMDIAAMANGGAPSTLTSMIESIINMRLTPGQRSQNVAFLAALHDVVLEFSGLYGNNPAEFLQYWREKGPTLAIVSPEDTDAVRILTVHKSKGLQFPCVHYPYASDALVSHAGIDTTWVATPAPLCAENYPPALCLLLTSKLDIPDSEFQKIYKSERSLALMDGFNRAYVAFTRAERELLLYCPVPGKRGAAYSCYAQLTEALLQTADDEEMRMGSDFYIDIARYVSDDGVLRIGAPTRPKTQQNGEDNLSGAVSLDGYEISMDGPGTSITAVEALMSVADDIDVDDDTDDEALSAANVGSFNEYERMIHVLCAIRRPSDAENILCRYRHFLADSVVRDIQSLLARQREDDPWDASAENILIQPTLYNPRADKLMRTRRPHRILHMAGNETRVVEFFHPAESPAAIDAHIENLHASAAMARVLFPGRTVRSVLFNIAQGVSAKI